MIIVDNVVTKISIMALYVFSAWTVVIKYPIRFVRYIPRPGPRLNIKTVLSTYGDFHVKDKTAVMTSYL